MTRLRMRVTSSIPPSADAQVLPWLFVSSSARGRAIQRPKQMAELREGCQTETDYPISALLRRHLLNQKRLNRAWQGVRWLLGLGSKKRGREEGRRKSNYVHEPIYPGKGQRPMKGRHERRRQSEGPKNNARRTRRRRKQAP